MVSQFPFDGRYDTATIQGWFSKIRYYSNSELIFKIHISLIPLGLYMTDDRFHSFPLMADMVLQQFSAVFENLDFIDNFATVYD